MELVGVVAVADLDDMGMTEDDLEDPDRWLSIDCEGSRQGYRDMEKFIAWEVEDEHLAELRKPKSSEAPHGKKTR